MRHRLEILAKNTCLLKLAAQSLATNYAKYFKPFPKYLQRNPKIEESTFILFHILTSSLSGFSIEWIIRHLLKNLSHQSLSKIIIIRFSFSPHGSKTFSSSQNDMVIETQKPGLAPPFFKTFPVKTAKDPPICTSAAIVEIATKRTKLKMAEEFERSYFEFGHIACAKVEGESLDCWRCYRIHPSRRNIVFPPIFPIYTSFFVVVFNSPIPSRGLVSKQPISIA